MQRLLACGKGISKSNDCWTWSSLEQIYKFLIETGLTYKSVTTCPLNMEWNGMLVLIFLLTNKENPYGGDIISLPAVYFCRWTVVSAQNFSLSPQVNKSFSQSTNSDCVSKDTLFSTLQSTVQYAQSKFSDFVLTDVMKILALLLCCVRKIISRWYTGKFKFYLPLQMGFKTI